MTPEGWAAELVTVRPKGDWFSVRVCGWVISDRESEGGAHDTAQVARAMLADVIGQAVADAEAELLRHGLRACPFPDVGATIDAARGALMGGWDKGAQHVRCSVAVLTNLFRVVAWQGARLLAFANDSEQYQQGLIDGKAQARERIAALEAEVEDLEERMRESAE